MDEQLRAVRKESIGQPHRTGHHLLHLNIICLSVCHRCVTDIIDIFKQVTFTNEQEREGGEKTDNKEEMKKNWKENYVPYDDNKDKKEVEQEEEDDNAVEEERDADEKDSYENEVDGKEKL